MGIFDSDKDKLHATMIRSLVTIMPKDARREVLGGLKGEDADNVRAALAASSAEIQQGVRTCDKCRAGKHGACTGHGCACG
jgi:hypothetical protein